VAVRFVGGPLGALRLSFFPDPTVRATDQSDVLASNGRGGICVPSEEQTHYRFVSPRYAGGQGAIGGSVRLRLQKEPVCPKGVTACLGLSTHVDERRPEGFDGRDCQTGQIGYLRVREGTLQSLTSNRIQN
jgi:hypothetical protein